MPTRTGLALSIWEAGSLLLIAVSVFWCWHPLTVIFSRSLGSEEYAHYSYVPLIPFLTAYLLYLNRREVFSHTSRGLAAGLPLILVGAVLLGSTVSSRITTDPETGLSVTMFGLVTIWIGAFVVCFGIRAVRSGAVAFVLLYMMVPLPPPWLTRLVVFLQSESANAVEPLLKLIGMPMLRDGFVFALPGLTIEVAQECSGIRSSLALFITSLVIADVFLRSTLTRVVLIAVIVPLAIAKNAVRIVALAWLSVHVDPSFITGSTVHRTSGIPIFLTSMAILAAIVWSLRKYEARGSAPLVEAK